MVNKFRKDRTYHLPHNAVLPEEFDFMLNCIDINKEYYTADEFRKLFLIEEVKEGVFSKFHSGQYKNFKEYNYEKLVRKLKKTQKNNYNYCTTELEEKVKEEGVKYGAKYVVDKRVSIFAKFEENPEQYVDELLDCEYTASKTWQGNWAESVRDYIQFFAYAGLLPCYYKGMNYKIPMDSGFYITKRLKKYLNGEIKLEEVILDYKYKNALIDIETYPMYNIRVRPFYSALKVLKVFNNKYNIDYIDRRVLAGIVSCINNEEEIEELIHEVYEKMDNKYDTMRNIVEDDSFYKEAGRFALTLLPYLLECNLVETETINRNRFVKISNYGIEVYNNTPRKAVYCYELIGSEALTPLVGYLLNYFRKSVENDKYSINISEISNDYIQQIINDSDQYKELRYILNDLYSHKDINVIKDIDEDVIYLNDISSQFSVNSGSDFFSIDDSNFVEEGSTIPIITEPNIHKEKIEPYFIEKLNELKKIAMDSDGELYENKLTSLMEELLGKNYVYELGNKRRAERLSDIAWKVPISINNRNKYLLIVIEAKAGNAVKSFDERKEEDDLKRTIKLFKDEIENIEGIWYWVVNGKSLPEQAHGGFRGNGVSFIEKLSIIQVNVTSMIYRPVIVSAMNCEAYIEYYKYLYEVTRGFNSNYDRINSFYVNEFWTWGKLFRPLSSYVRIFNDAEDFKKYLFN
ncbi:MAG: hypothetical protein ACOC4L_04520 [Halanaerobium sp.]